MATSLLRTGGFGTVSTASTAANPTILYAPLGTQSAASYGSLSPIYPTIVDADGGAANAYTIKNTSTTSQWLWVQIMSVNAASRGGVTVQEAVILESGERLPFVVGDNDNGIRGLVAWITANGATTSGSSGIVVIGGIQKAVS